MKKIRIILTIIGIVLILSALGLLVFSKLSSKTAQENAKEIVSELYSLMPEIDDGVPDERASTAMPVLQIDGVDFVGILEVPQYSSTLPIYSKWDTSRVRKYPCRYWGSVYSDVLVLGGSDSDGQLDFVKAISNGDSIYITDTTGMRYKYTVCDINRTQDVSTENLTKTNAKLVLFARNTYSFDYTVIYCE